MTQQTARSGESEGGSENAFVEFLEQLIHLGNLPEPCPYLPDRVATLELGDGATAAPWYEELLERGYRRSGAHVYRPVCRDCAECKTLRVLVREFRRSKGQRRVWNRAESVFEITIEEPSFSEEKLEVYTEYLRFQHPDSEPPDEEHYTRFLVDSCIGGKSLELQYRAAGRLAGLGILDRMGDALSSVYFYFDPAFARYGLGTYSALYEIELARSSGLAYYYLGYYIRACASMNYKVRYRPCEYRGAGEEEWRRIER